MKKLLLSLIAIVLFSNLSNGQVKQDELETFKKDELTIQLKVNFYNFLNNLVKEDSKAIYSSISEGNLIIEKLNTKFGKDKVTLYLNVLDNSESSFPTDSEINKICGTHG